MGGEPGRFWPGPHQFANEGAGGGLTSTLKHAVQIEVRTRQQGATMKLSRIVSAAAFLAVVFTISTVQAQLEPIVGQAPAGGLRPFSAPDRARVEELLRSFDPNSYDFHYQYLDASGKPQAAHVGMANLTQTNTVRSPGSAAASTVNTINIFRQASTVNTINIFKQASTVNTINIFKDPNQQAKAQELNAILQRYSGPAPASPVRESPTRISESAASKGVVEGGMKPLSAQDKARVDELLKSFDPNSYDFRYHYLDASGKEHAAQVGQAKGLANLRQSETVRGQGSTAASTVNTINIFRQASTVNTINIFKQANVSCCTMIPEFNDPSHRAKVQELNAILQKYVAP
jgi:hypothetical protein